MIIEPFCIENLISLKQIEKILLFAKSLNKSFTASSHKCEATENLMFASLAVMTTIKEMHKINLFAHEPAVILSSAKNHIPTPHADKHNLDGTAKTGFENFDISSVLYLNNDFIGGDLVFQRTGIRIRPKPGLIAVYSGGVENVHYVDNITSGDRWACPMWFSIIK